MPSTQEHYQKVIQRCKSIFLKKNKDYDTAWRILQLPSFTDQIFIKGKRIRTIQNKNAQIKDSVEHELLGIINYTILALIQIKLANDARLNIPDQELSNGYDTIVQENLQLLKKKNHDYGEAWRDMRVNSMVDIILMKLLRIKKIEDNQGHTLASEGIEAGYRDIINYAVFALIQLSETPLQ